jgi:EAL domain-containing protein (putative c-di-GMP-specific phosphodiesterase class I)
VGLGVPKLSVNVSSRRLLDRDLIRGLSDLDLPRGVLSFELLESVFLDELNDTIAWNIDMLKEIGIEIELDDFGSGHASIVGLVKLGPHAIKIDRELVTSITVDPARSALLQSIVDICRSLRTRVIAEGVETGAQAEMLHGLGCDALQGYHFAKPMPADEFERFVERWHDRLERAVGHSV